MNPAGPLRGGRGQGTGTESEPGPGSRKRLTKRTYSDILGAPCSRGVSGALYLQSAIAGVMAGPGSYSVGLPKVSGVDVWVLRDRNL